LARAGRKGRLEDAVAYACDKTVTWLQYSRIWRRLFYADEHLPVGGLT